MIAFPPLDPEAIRSGLPHSSRIGREILVLEETSSTNDIAAQLGRDGIPEGVVVFAENQTAGRGRLQRKWESLSHKGLWFSVLLRPSWDFSEWSRLATWAAVGIARGLDEVLPGIQSGIKWPNDVYLRGKKAVGILCESAAGPGGFAVVGIGVNVNHLRTDFPEELQVRATSLLESAGPDTLPFDRQTVAATLLKHLDALYPTLECDFASVLAEAESKSILLGRRITIRGALESDPTYEAIAERLEPDGSLRIRLDNGGTRIVSGGEVSIGSFAS